MSRLSTGNARATLKLRGDDLYETPPEATWALPRAENLPRHLWEPAPGRGAIVNVLRDAAHTVIASDLVDYGCPTHFARHDFLMERKAPDGCEAIVTNPSFKLAGEFVIESERRTAILDAGHLARIYVFRKRLPIMHRGGWQGNKTGSAICYGWFVWDRNHRGPTMIGRISWKPETPETGLSLSIVQAGAKARANG